MTSQKQKKNRLLVLWTHPRSRSTAFERMMGERGDFLVAHEPFCSLVDTAEAMLPGPHGTALRIQGHDAVLEYLLSVSERRPVFVKETCEYRYPFVWKHAEFMRASTHALLIREPVATINSHYAMNPGVSLEELGYGHLNEIVSILRELGIKVSTVLDADEIMSNPERAIRQFCQHVGIQFLPGALRWDAGFRTEWQRTARWHERVAATTGFQCDVVPAYSTTVDNDPRLQALCESCLPEFWRLKALQSQQ